MKMTVEQAIKSINNLKYFVERTLFDDKTISVSLSMAIKALEENDTLKNEIKNSKSIIAKNEILLYENKKLRETFAINTKDNNQRQFNNYIFI